ncbi:MAG: hypothetical protein MOP51_1254, partial [Citricoccus sp.]|nr:hypothetical protein [Citricoccus sp. WCRC_4]
MTTSEFDRYRPPEEPRRRRRRDRDSPDAGREASAYAVGTATAAGQPTGPAGAAP